MSIPQDMWDSFLVLYVSDILVGKSLSWVSPWAKQIMSKDFDIKDLDKAPFVLGIEINRDRWKNMLGLPWNHTLIVSSKLRYT